MTREQFEREKLYRCALMTTKILLKRGLVSDADVQEIMQIIIKKYRPPVGSLQSESSPNVSDTS